MASIGMMFVRSLMRNAS